MTHDHAASPVRAGERHVRPLVLTFFMVATVMVVEVVGGLLTNSLALLSDAGHMGTDALCLGMALAAIVAASRAGGVGQERSTVTASTAPTLASWNGSAAATPRTAEGIRAAVMRSDSSAGSRPTSAPRWPPKRPLPRADLEPGTQRPASSSRTQRSSARSTELPSGESSHASHSAASGIRINGVARRPVALWHR